PQIEELKKRSREPVTLLIDSDGGYGYVARRILSHLRSGENGDFPRRVITVAMPQASSAAAELLSAGDFAIALPTSALLYHGAGYSDLKTLPRLSEDVVDEMEAVTARANERSAAALRCVYERRFMFMLSALRPECERYRAENNDLAITDLECF